MKVKTFFKYIFFLALMSSFGLMSCENLQPERAFVSGQFLTTSDSTLSAGENAATATVTITRRGTTDFSAALDVTYEVTGIFAKDNSTISDVSQFVTITPSNGEAGKLVIPSGAASATISFTTIDNAAADGNKVITLKITNSDAGFPGEANRNNSVELTIGDDDCAFDIATFAGDYSVSDPDNPFGTTAYDVTITTDAATNKLTITGVSGLDGRSVVADISPDITNPTITIPNQTFTPTTTVNSGANVVGYGTDDTASNTYTSCDGNFSLTLFLRAYDATGTNILGSFNGGNPYTVVFTKK